MSNLARITEEIAAQMEARAGEMLHRLSPEGRRQRQRQRARRRAAFVRMMRRAVIAALAVLVAAIGYAVAIGPIEEEGLLAVALLLILTVAGVIAFSAPAKETPDTLASSELPLLPERAEAWLAAQRPALPAPAARITDTIGVRLEAIAPQLHGLDPREPAVAEIRKLIAEELPELVEGYHRVPEPLRRIERDGFPSPDRQLVDGLRLVDEELHRMCEQLSRGDLHKLATQGRYLELKYRGDGSEG